MISQSNDREYLTVSDIKQHLLDTFGLNIDNLTEEQIRDLVQNLANREQKQRQQRIREVLAKIEEFRLIPNDLGMRPAAPPRYNGPRPEKGKTYLNTTGEQWVGGTKGPAPQWVKDQIAAEQQLVATGSKPL